MNEKTLRKLLDRDPDKAITMIIDEYGRGIHTICTSILRGFTKEDIEEAESDVYLKLWKNRAAICIDETHSLKSYLYTIARNTAIDMYRRSVRQQDNLYTEDALDELLMDDVNVEDEALGRIISQLLHQVIAGLGEPDCNVFYGKYFLFLKNREIAQRLGMSEKRVENILYRGKEKLRKALRERGISGYEHESI